MIGFGEFEEEEFRERMKLLGFTIVDEDALFNAKAPENLSLECEVPESFHAFDEMPRERQAGLDCVYKDI